MVKPLLLFIANTNNFTLLYTQLKDLKRRDGKSFIFGVCRLPFAVNVDLKLLVPLFSSRIAMFSGYRRFSYDASELDES